MKKKKQQEQKKNILYSAEEVLGISPELTFDIPNIVAIGDSDLTIENYKGVVGFDEKKIIIDANPKRILIHGEGLEIKSMAKELIYIKGKIKRIRLDGEV